MEQFFRKRFGIFWMGAITTLVVLLWGGQLLTVQAAPSLDVYQDSLATGWQDWSWGTTRQFANGSPVQSGSTSLAVTYTEAWGGLYLRAETAVSTASVNSLQFWLHGGSGGGQQLMVKVINGSEQWSSGYAVTAVSQSWQLVTIPLSALGNPSSIVGLVWQDSTGATQPTVYLDNIALVNDNTPTPTPAPTAVPGSGPTLTINASADHRPISPHIYGMNFPEDDLAAELQLPVARWGGNATSRYNWQLDVSNRASDWFFENIANDVANLSALPSGSSSDQFVSRNHNNNTDSIITIPMMGWTPKSRSRDCAFSVAKYGAQQQTDPWAPDCGNGISSSGAEITSNDPADTSLAIDETFVQEWIAHLNDSFGAADEGGVRFYNLDNEPMLWHHTHRDVHPGRTSYDEIRDLTYQYGAAIKEADPAAQTLGPVAWGWPAYFFSAADGDWWISAPDRAAHGGVAFVPWYLQQMAAYEDAHGVRILDYLDLHYYPQQSGVALQGVGSAATQALRLRSTRALWDESYVDESWIDEPIYLLPRMRDWVDANYPGTKLAITEYNWGGLEHINGAVTQAEVLGIFGREGLDLATLWDPPAANEPGAYAFRMFLNYDGENGRFGETSVQASSSKQSDVAIYASLRDEDGALLLLLVNKSQNGLTSPVNISNFTPATQAQVYRYSAANLNAIVREADLAVGSSFDVTLPAMSLTLLVLPEQTTPPPPAEVPQSPQLQIDAHNGVAELHWLAVAEDVAGGETAVSQYRIYRTTTLDASPTAPYTTTASGTTSWSDPEVGTWFYTITAMNTAGESVMSNQVGVFAFSLNQAGD